MALVLKDRVQESAAPNTTVSFTCNGAITGFQAFSVIGNGNTTFYTAVDASGNWENGVGTYTTAGNLVTRTTISASSNAGSAVTFSGTVNLFISYPATKSINYDANGVATIGETLGYSDTGLVSSFASTVAGYNQVVVQNKSTATNASSNLNVSNDAGTASQNYAELGINSSTFSNGAGCFNIPGAAYVASAGEDLSIGTYNSHNIHFATNSNTTDSMTIYTSGGISLGTYGDPGLGNVAGNKFVAGYSSITSAAGTTILTAASTYYQRVVGTAIQTIQLPDATTCLVGTTFIIENDSTGLLTIRDNASGAIDVIPAGGVDYIYLIANGTVAGTWARYALLPSTYNFNATAADFGAATLSNGVWNGTPIAYNYGGTTLTTFAAANNALYSTSATALTAGTLPVLAGGTGVTTSTGTGSTVLSASPTLVTPILGTPTSGTLTNCTFPTLNQDTTGNSATATTLIGNQTNWASYRTSAVANMLSWKNYSNGHVIFDASNSTSPTGSAVNNTTAATPWAATYPTLMGWNGSGTYGVRVDSARVSDSTVTNANLTGAVTSVGNASLLGSFTSLQLLTALTDQTGTGVNVFATSPTLVTPALGTPSALVGTNITGTATNFTATRVTTNANLTGAVTSVGNASLLGSFTSLQLLTALTDQTGTGATVFAVSPAFTGVPTAPTAVVGTNTTQIATTANVYASSIGQTWTDVTATRALSTTYTNSTGRTIAINYWTGGSATASSSFVVNGVTIYVCTNNTVGGVINSGAGWIVPPGATYRVLANVALTKWFELR